MTNAEILLIAGNEGSGKTPVCKNIDKLLRKNGYNEITCKNFKNKEKDYIVQLQKENTIVIICTASDLRWMIDVLIDFIKAAIDALEEGQRVVLIFAARNTGDPMREYLEDKINEIVNISNLVEVPLARINQKAQKTVHSWYHNAIDKLVEHILKVKPFCII